MIIERLPRYMTQAEVKRFFGAIKDHRDKNPLWVGVPGAMVLAVPVRGLAVAGLL